MSALINLLPWRAQRLKKRALFWTMLFTLGLAFIALGGGTGRWYINQQIAQVRLMPPLPAQLQALRDDNARQRQRLDSITALHQQHLVVLYHQHVLQNWAQRLGQLASQLPDAVWFSALRYDAGRLEITGKSLTTEALSDWAGVVKALPGVSVVHQGATTRDTDAAWRFNWTLAMEPDDAPTH